MRLGSPHENSHTHHCSEKMDSLRASDISFKTFIRHKILCFQFTIKYDMLQNCETFPRSGIIITKWFHCNSSTRAFGLCLWTQVRTLWFPYARINIVYRPFLLHIIMSRSDFRQWHNSVMNRRLKSTDVLFDSNREPKLLFCHLGWLLWQHLCDPSLGNGPENERIHIWNSAGDDSLSYILNQFITSQSESSWSIPLCWEANDRRSRGET